MPASARTGPSLEIQPGVAKPGDPVLVTLRGWPLAPSGTLGKRALRFYAIDGGFQALTALAVEQALGELEVRLTLPAPKGAAPAKLSGVLEVIEPGYPSRELKVARRFVVTPKGARQQIAEDKAALARAFAQAFSAPRFTQNFILPRQAQVTAPFGDLRRFNGKKSSQHYGIDLDGKVGAPILAANEGLVVLARDCYTSGKTVILSHGADLYTTYFHLSAIEVKAGQQVRQGERLGLLGRTGRVTGPHLHWGVKVEGRYVDGATLLGLDFASGQSSGVAASR